MMDYYKVSKETIGLIYKAHQSLEASPLDPKLRVLVDLYVSQMNGCHYCVEIHSKEGRELGVPQETLDQLETWRSSELFSDKERAALRWCELVTEVDPEGNKSALLPHFSEREQVDLTAAISLINALNRIAIYLR